MWHCGKRSLGVHAVALLCSAKVGEKLFIRRVHATLLLRRIRCTPGALQIPADGAPAHHTPKWYDTRTPESDCYLHETPDERRSRSERSRGRSHQCMDAKTHRTAEGAASLPIPANGYLIFRLECPQLPYLVHVASGPFAELRRLREHSWCGHDVSTRELPLLSTFVPLRCDCRLGGKSLYSAACFALDSAAVMYTDTNTLIEVAHFSQRHMK